MLNIDRFWHNYTQEYSVIVNPKKIPEKSANTIFDIKMRSMIDKSDKMLYFSKCIAHPKIFWNTKIDYNPDTNTCDIYNIFSEDYKAKITDYIHLIESNKCKKLSHFLKSDFDPSVLNNLGLRIACKKGHYGCVKQLLCDKKVDISDLKYGALKLALVKGHIGIIKLLLNHLDICLAHDLYSIFMLAAPNPHLLDLLLRNFECVHTKRNCRLLISYNNCFLFKKCISYALRSLIKNNHIQVVKNLLIDKIISNQSVIKICIEHKNSKLINEFSNGSSIDYCKLLTYATKCNSKIEIIRFLLKKMDKYYDDLTVAIDYALHLKNYKVFALLAFYQQNYIKNRGKYAIECSIAINCVEILEFLLNYRMLNIPINNGKYLSFACLLGYEKIFKILLPISDDTYIDNDLLVSAILYKRMEIVEQLIPITAFNDINQVDVKYSLNKLKYQKILQAITTIFIYSKIGLIKDIVRKIIYLLMNINNLIHLIHLN